MKSEPGTYALLLRSRRSAEIQIGRWGSLRIAPGYYVYVGSAFGPGGVHARVARHFRKAKKPHWHIDYLRAETDAVRAWCSYAPVRLEHDWARAFGEMRGISCIEGFGCSDCRCKSHLFSISSRPRDAEVLRALGKTVESWPNGRSSALD